METVTGEGDGVLFGKTPDPISVFVENFCVK
jgi:hypothetical protein